MIVYIKLVAFSIILYGLVYALPHARSCCDSDAKSSTLQFQVWCLTLFHRRPVKARWRGCLGILDIYTLYIPCPTHHRYATRDADATQTHDMEFKKYTTESLVTDKALENMPESAMSYKRAPTRTKKKL